MARYGTINRDYGIQMVKTDPEVDTGIYMLNFMKYRETAIYAEGAEEGVSGREADDRYAPIDVLAAIGAHMCFLADVETASEDWDRIAVVRYASRRSFVEMQNRDDFRKKHVHKEAGMDHTTIMGTTPVAGLPSRAKPNRILLEAWKGATPATVIEGESVTFGVEGTIIGDGREWSGARYTEIDGAAGIDFSLATPEYQLVVVKPVIERWQ
jgi:hypothetical protein